MVKPRLYIFSGLERERKDVFIYIYKSSLDLNSSFVYSQELQKLLHVCKVLVNILPQLKHTFGMAYFYLTYIFFCQKLYPECSQLETVLMM